MTTAVDNRLAKLEAQELSIAHALCKRSFVDFLDYVYILEPADPQNGIMGGPAKFQKWEYQLDFVEVLMTEKQIVLGKARQLGFSWLMSAYAVWQAWRNTNYIVLELSRGQYESQKLLNKAKFIYRHLPLEWQLPISKDSGSEFSFVGSNSVINALPSTEDAGTGETASLVVQDEAEKHEYLDAAYSAIEPTINAGGQIVMGSSRKKMRGANFFINTYGLASATPAEAGRQKRWRKVFWGAYERPGRDEEWYRQVKSRAMGLQEAQVMGVELFMEQEYPRDETEFLRASALLSAFDHDALDAMKANTKPPIEKIGPINVYQKWRLGGRYVAGSDTGHGVGKDFSVTVLMDTATGYVVADIMMSNISVEEFAHQSIKMMELYEKPVWAIEDNDRGFSVIRAAERARYPRLWRRKTSRKTTKTGWHADKVSRDDMWTNLIATVNSGQATVPNLAGLQQFYNIIRNPEKEGHIEHLAGTHDDYPTAVGIACLARGSAYSSGSNVKVGTKW